MVWTGVAGTPYYSNFYWVESGATAASNAWQATAAWADYQSGAVINELTLTVQSEIAQIDPVDGEITAFFTETEGTFIGQDLSEPLPFQVQMRTRLLTAGIVGGRRVTGSCFTAGVPESYNTTGVGPAEANRIAIESGFVDNLVDATGASLCVWSKPVDGGRAGSTHEVVGAATSPIWSQLRSRRAQ